MRYLLMIMNSPASVRRVYKLLVNGSKHSLYPRIWLVDAVGIGAMSSELRRPFEARVLRAAQSKVPSSSVIGFTAHISGCRTPLLAGDPANDE